MSTKHTIKPRPIISFEVEAVVSYMRGNCVVILHAYCHTAARVMRVKVMGLVPCGKCSMRLIFILARLTRASLDAAMTPRAPQHDTLRMR